MNLGNVIMTMGGVDAILLDEGKERKIAFGTRARLMRIRELLRGEAQIYEQERIRLVKEFGSEVEKDGEKVINVDDAKLDDFYKELEKVLGTEVDITYKKLTAEQFKDIEDLDIKVTDQQLKALFEFVFEAGVAD